MVVNQLSLGYSATPKHQRWRFPDAWSQPYWKYTSTAGRNQCVPATTISPTIVPGSAHAVVWSSRHCHHFCARVAQPCGHNPDVSRGSWWSWRHHHRRSGSTPERQRRNVWSGWFYSSRTLARPRHRNVGPCRGHVGGKELMPHVPNSSNTQSFLCIDGTVIHP